MKHHMRLPHDETDERKRYSIADPDALHEQYASAREQIYPCVGNDGPPRFTVTLTREEASALEALAGAYLFLTTYPLGQECAVSKLRDIWRARRERQS